MDYEKIASTIIDELNKYCRYLSAEEKQKIVSKIMCEVSEQSFKMLNKYIETYYSTPSVFQVNGEIVK